MRFLLLSLSFVLLSSVDLISQNIGLNHLSPSRDIDAAGTMRITNTSSGSLPQLDLQEDGGISSYTRLRFGNDQNANYWLLAARPQDTTVSGRFNIFNSVTGNALTITESGNVGLNVNGPSAMLHINSENGSDLLRIQNNGSTKFRIFDNSSFSFGTNNENVSANDAYFHYQIGIGVSDPSERLDVNGTVKASGLQVTTNASSGRVLTSNASGVATWQNPQGDDLGNHAASQEIDMQGNIIINLEYPNNKNDAANKDYVDSHQDGDASSTNEKINLLQVAWNKFEY